MEVRSLFVFLTLALLFFTPHRSSSRRILHQPFFPVTDSPPPIAPSPSPQPQPQPQPKHPFSSITPPAPTHHHHHHFFPFYTSPTTVPSTSVPTFPANISSVILPPSPSSSKPISKKLLALSLSLSLLSVAFVATVVASLLYHRNRNHKPPSSDSLRLFPPNLPTSDNPPPPPPTLPSNSTPTSSEFLYLGTLVSPHRDQTLVTALGYKRLGSPDLQPLPPLPRLNFPHRDDDDTDEYFSPKASPDASTGAFQRDRSNPASPTHTTRPISSNSPSLPPPPPPPPMPPPVWETQTRVENHQTEEDVFKPKLKPLHWDKVRASSERTMVWDRLKFSSFQ